MKQKQYIQWMLAAFFAFAGITVQAQRGRVSSTTNPVRVGRAILNLGVGVGADYRGDNYGNAFGTKVAVEVGLWQAGPGVITLGGEFGGSFASGGRRDYDDYRARTVILAVRSAWHAGWDVPGLDTYGGFSLGPGFHHYDWNHGDYHKNEVIPVFGAFIGASYFISPKFGFNAEAGYDITNFQVGIVCRLN